MLWIFEDIFLSLESVHGSNCKSILTQKPVEVHYCPVSDSDRSVLPAPQCYIIAINETFFPSLCQEMSSAEFMFAVFLSVFSIAKAWFKNGLCRNCSEFPFILIEVICLQMKMSLT